MENVEIKNWLLGACANRSDEAGVMLRTAHETIERLERQLEEGRCAIAEAQQNQIRIQELEQTLWDILITASGLAGEDPTSRDALSSIRSDIHSMLSAPE
ncbi:hypothetical protein DN824_07030 [Stutzerimonas nosocomialis]|uniref:Uncharacterized protein n=1 Tax=Stutzerimonas nosocomialis TaxID=1056496 RepID=A0A5R9QFB7_9GAMM|nr:hypothetical protein [Stutzerimonas nosocomialis]TLX55867.1 hypothetical protein DN826_09970 [Stutzerimonas nosocomialis]TLX59920.1 hypothetical protein DN824_07030 [Stutzerimonas nosocomialis]TLX63836.1 hypothetical protein DN820_09045 [Stutzerimonas nosocomialis]